MTTRILLVNAHGTDLAAGGAETHVCRLALLLTERGYDVTILAAFPQAGPAVARTLTLHRSDAGKNHLRRIATHVGDIASIPSSTLQRAVAHIAPDVVHTHNLSGISTGVWEVCHRQGVPVVHTLHDYGLLCPWVTLMRPSGERCHPHPPPSGRAGPSARSLGRRRRGCRGGVRARPQSPRRALCRRAPRCDSQPVRAVGARGPDPPAATDAGLRHRVSRSPGYIKGVQHLVAIGPELAAMGISLRIAGDGRLRPEVERLAAEYLARCITPAS